MLLNGFSVGAAVQWTGKDSMVIVVQHLTIRTLRVAVVGNPCLECCEGDVMAMQERHYFSVCAPAWIARKQLFAPLVDVI